MKGTAFIRERTLKPSEKYPDGQTRYYVYAKIGSNQYPHGGYSSKRDANRMKRQIEIELASGTYGKSTEAITFKVFAEKWLEDYRPSIKASTFIAYQYDNRKHLIPHFGRKLLSNITARDVQGYVTLKLKQGLSPRTVNKNLTVLRLMFKHAIIQGYLDKDPAQFVKRPRVPHKEMDFLRPKEVELLIEASPPDYKALFATAVLTGARQGELFALRWGDLDLDRGVMFIRRTYHARIGFAEPKTKAANRAVSISPRLVNILFEHQAITGGDPDALVFSKDGEPLVGQNMVRDVFHPILKGAGIRRVRFHDLRHTYAAMMIAQDCNMKWLQGQMGHSSITTTMDRYGHLLEEVGSDMPAKLDALIFTKNLDHSPRSENEN